MKHCICGHLDIQHTIQNPNVDPSRRGCNHESCVCIAFQESLLDPDRSKDIHIEKSVFSDYYLFLDYETTGNPDQKLLEIAWMLTDTNLTVLLPCESQVICQPIFTIEEEVLKMHTRNGLLTEVASSTTNIDGAAQRVCTSLETALNDLHSFGTSRFALEPRIILAGFTCHFDRELMKRDMPRLSTKLHFRHFDVSVLRGAYSNWVEKIPSKKNEHPHRASNDVMAAWEIAKTFQTLFKIRMPKLNDPELEGMAI